MISRNQDEWEELTQIMNDYMGSKDWTIRDALNYMRCVLIKSAKMSGVKKHVWDKQCEAMKNDFDDCYDYKLN